jgi:ATP-dependent RNA helicase DDX27
MLYPSAIEDDDKLPAENGSSSDEEIQATKVRKKKKRVNTDFSDNFTFSGADTQNEDHLDGLKKFLEKTTPSYLQMNIEKERKKLKGINLVPGIVDQEIEVGADQLDNDDEELIQEHAEKDDRVREKEMKLPKKKSKQDEYFDVDSNAIVAAGKQSDLTFQDMNLSRPILKAVVAAGFTTPTAIQASCIPVALAGRDICACSATGTGKTAAFMLPILERLLYKPKQKAQTRVLVLVPTRELAIQVFQVSRKLAEHSAVEICLCAGGLDLKAQEAALRLGLDVVIATPGRLIDHLKNAPGFSLHGIEVLVLDEADRMLDETFEDEMKEIIGMCSKNRQTMLFSATMTDEIEELAKLSLQKPVKLFINENSQTAENLRQEFVRIRDGRENEREAITAALVTRNFPDHTIIFMKTKKDCARMHVILGLLGVKCAQMHGNLSQTMRVQALQKFKLQQVDVLVCTELAARGLDIEGVMTVINMQMPDSVQQYIHRVGRTARAGKAGRAISLVGEGERKLLKSIVKHNQHSTIKQRNLAPEVIAAYKERIETLESSIERVQREAVIDNQLRLTEDKLAKVEKKVLTGEDEREGRIWMKSAAEKKKEEIKAQNALRKLITKKEKQQKTPEDQAAEKEAAYQARQIKKAHKPKRMRAFAEDDPKGKRNGKKRKKSSFVDHLTDTSSKAVKKFRYGPEDEGFRKAKQDQKKQGKLKNRRRN